MQLIREDPTTRDTRLADYLLDLNPATTDTLVNLTMGGDSSGTHLDFTESVPVLRSGEPPRRTSR